MGIDMKLVSDDAIPRYIYLLPAHLQSQPPLVEDWCTDCVPPFTGRTFDEDKVRKALEGRNCTRRNEYSNCTACTKLNRSCHPVPDRFRRAFNMLSFVMAVNSRRIRKVNPEAEDAPVLIRGWLKDIWELANHINQGIIDYRAFMKRETGNDPVKLESYRRDRAASREHNFARYKNGLGGVGQCAPANFVVPVRFEEHFTKLHDNGEPKGAPNNERRYWYYGPEVPSANSTSGGGQMALVSRPAPSPISPIPPARRESITQSGSGSRAAGNTSPSKGSPRRESGGSDAMNIS